MADVLTNSSIEDVCDGSPKIIDRKANLKLATVIEPWLLFIFGEFYLNCFP